jgi:hypothetical protein
VSEPVPAIILLGPEVTAITEKVAA